MNIVFLDIDGVLNSDNIFLIGKYRLDCIDPNCMEFFLNTIQVIPNCKIVISSSWKTDSLEQFEKTVKEFNCRNQICKIFPYLHNDFSTKRLDGNRGHEVAEWLSRHSDIDKYLCIDDSSDYDRNQPLLRLNRFYGFGYTEQLLVWQYFGVKDSSDKNYGISTIQSRLTLTSDVLKNKKSFIKHFLS